MDTFPDVPPLTWTGKPKFEKTLKELLEQIVRNYPEAPGEKKVVTVIRTISQRIIGNLEHANLPAYDPQEVSCQTIWSTLKREQHIHDDDTDAEHEWTEALADAWELFHLVLSLTYTESKPDDTPDDD